MQVGPAGLLILLVVLAGFGAVAAFGTVMAARALARTRPPRQPPTAMPLRPATSRGPKAPR